MRYGHNEITPRYCSPAGDGAPEKIRVLVAHPNHLVSAGLEALLRAQHDFEVIRGDGPCLMLSPAHMESVSVVITECAPGLGVASARPRACRVLIVTADESEVSIRRAVEQGVAGYLLLVSTGESIVRAVRRIHHGGTEFDPIVTSKIAASLATPGLSPRELEVLHLVTAGLSDKAIARRLGRSLGTVKSHVKAILSKLGSASRTEAAAVARRRGLVVTPPTVLVTPERIARSSVRDGDGSRFQLSPA